MQVVDQFLPSPVAGPRRDDLAVAIDVGIARLRQRDPAERELRGGKVDLPQVVRAELHLDGLRDGCKGFHSRFVVNARFRHRQPHVIESPDQQRTGEAHEQHQQRQRGSAPGMHGSQQSHRHRQSMPDAARLETHEAQPQPQPGTMELGTGQGMVYLA